MANNAGSQAFTMRPWQSDQPSMPPQPGKPGENMKLPAAHTGLIVRLAQLSAMVTYTLPPTADHVRINKCLDQLEFALRDHTTGTLIPVHQVKNHEPFNTFNLVESDVSEKTRQAQQDQQQRLLQQRRQQMLQQQKLASQQQGWNLPPVQQYQMAQQQPTTPGASGLLASDSASYNSMHMPLPVPPPYADKPLQPLICSTRLQPPHWPPGLESVHTTMRDQNCSSPPRGHALQDYQMQLMLLERQNRKRLEMAKQDQLARIAPEATAASAARSDRSYTRSELIEHAGWNDESLFLTINVKPTLQAELGGGEHGRYSRMRQRNERDAFLSSLGKTEKHPLHTLTRMKIIKSGMLNEIEQDILDQQRLQLKLYQYPAWKRFAFLRFAFERDLYELTNQQDTLSDVLIARQAAGIKSAIASIRTQAESLRGLDRGNESREYDGFDAWWSTESPFVKQSGPAPDKPVGKRNDLTQKDEREDPRPPLKKVRGSSNAPDVDRLLHDIRSRRLKKLEEEQTSLEGADLGTELEKLALIERINLPFKQTEPSEWLVPGKEEDPLQATARAGADSSNSSGSGGGGRGGDTSPADISALFTGNSKILLRSCQLYTSMESDRLVSAWYCARALTSEIVQRIAADRRFGEQSDHELFSISAEMSDIVVMLAPLVARRNALKARQPEMSLAEEKLHRSLKCLNEQELRISINLGDLCYDFACLKSGHASISIRKRMSHVASDIKARLGLWTSLSDEVETALAGVRAVSRKSALARAAPTRSPPAVANADETEIPASPTSDDEGFTVINRDA